MNGPYTTVEVANWFIVKARESECFNLNHMKIQKLVYLAHGWSLEIYDKPLVCDSVYAASYGPYFSTLYQALIETSNASLTGEMIGISYNPETEEIKKYFPQVDKEDKDVIALLERIWEVYGVWTPYQCSNYCHNKKSAWWVVAQQFKKYADDDDIDVPDGVVIPNELIKKTFSDYRDNED